MDNSTPFSSARATLSKPIRIGFVPLVDAAPMIVAEAQGLFRSHGLQVRLSREVGWATVRDKIVYRELDAAHAVASMAFGTTLGLGCRPTPCLTACVLNTNGNAITLSSALKRRGVHKAEDLRVEALRIRHERQLVFGVVFALSSQNILLRQWLRSAGLDPDRDVRIVVVPPPQLHRNLLAGNLDGYCVGEPWNSLAVREKTGWIAATSAEISRDHPEKVLLVRSDFAEERHEEHLALVAALTEAAALCDQPEFRSELPNLLARREYLDLPPAVLAPSLVGPFQRGGNLSATDANGIVQFHERNTSVPDDQKAHWLLNGLASNKLLPSGMQLEAGLASKVFRSDLHRAAIAMVTRPR